MAANGRPSGNDSVVTAKVLLGAAGGLAVVALVVLGVTTIGDSDTSPAPAPRDNPAPSLQDCVERWNGAANAKQRAALNKAALAGPSGPPAAPGGVPLRSRVLVLRYSGPPLENVGVGEARVNASRGDCIVAHTSNVLFLYAKDTWHQVGYSPGLAFEGIPQQAARSPNAVMVIREPGAGQAANAGRIALTN
jgi:hypothetical protein